MTEVVEDKKEMTKDEMLTKSVVLAKQDDDLTAQIKKLTDDRTVLRKQRRALEGKLLTIQINEKKSA